VTKAYESALEELHRAPYESFVAERKRLAGELAKRDRDGAGRLDKLRRPSVTAWAVNQLWWRERSAFQRLFATAESVRDGDLSQVADHRSALQLLRDRASKILSEGGHGTSEGALRRVVATLSALAAQGGFGSHAPGTLPHDLESPGFAAIGDATLEKLAARPRQQEKASKKAESGPSRAELLALRRQEERERAERKAERERVESSLRRAQAAVEAREQALATLRREHEAARSALTEAKAKARELEKRLAMLARAAGDAPASGAPAGAAPKRGRARGPRRGASAGKRTGRGT
jgi:hypothetical protein